MGIKEVCCTVEGLRALKKTLTLFVAVSFITVSVLAFVIPPGIINIFVGIRAVWNIIFGLLMVSMQFSGAKYTAKHFGFLSKYTGRGLFFLFCGTNIWDMSGNSVLNIITWIVGGAAIFCGCLEFVFGCRCESQDDNMKIPEVQEQPQESQKKSGFFGVFGGGAGSDSGGPKASMSGAGTSAEPSFTVNVTASQAAAAAGAAAGVAKSVAASDNPFLGNKHLTD